MPLTEEGCPAASRAWHWAWREKSHVSSVMNGRYSYLVLVLLEYYMLGARKKWSCTQIND
jgi:hypothetical protein